MNANREPYRKWKPEEEQVALELLDNDAPDSAFRERLGRSKEGASSHFRYSAAKHRTKPSRQAAARDKAVPDHVIEDAKRRLSAEQSITAAFFGDPRPGQSALDQREDAQ